MDGKQVLITGATDGIGLAAAEALAGKVANVAIVGRNETRPSALRRRASGEVKAEERRNRRYAGCRPVVATPRYAQLANEVLARYAKIDILMNNAGAMHTHAAGDRGWDRAHLGGQPSGTLPADNSAPRPAQGERSGSRIITTASEAHQGAHIPLEDLNAERSYRRLRALQGQIEARQHPVHERAGAALEGSGVTALLLPPWIGRKRLQPQQRASHEASA